MTRILVGVVVAWASASAACGPRTGETIPLPVPDPAAPSDPINRLDAPRLRRTAARVLTELIVALPDEARARVARTSLLADDALGDVNAYASCDARGEPIVAISDGLLLVAAHLAMATATDERFETGIRTAYLDWLADHGTLAPPPGFYAPAHHVDRGKLARQHELFDEAIAFVLGHELAHHTLGHLACSSGDGVGEALGRRAASEVPLFNQTSELAADVAAVRYVLTAGERRARSPWTEDGALLVISAFHRRHELSTTDLVFAFERSHPLPHLRVPVITSTAELWYTTRGLLGP